MDNEGYFDAVHFFRYFLLDGKARFTLKVGRQAIAVEGDFPSVDAKWPQIMDWRFDPVSMLDSDDEDDVLDALADNRWCRPCRPRRTSCLGPPDQPKGRQGRLSGPRTWAGEIPKNELERLYLQERLSTGQIAARYHMQRGTVADLLRSHGIPLGWRPPVGVTWNGYNRSTSRRAAPSRTL